MDEKAFYKKFDKYLKKRSVKNIVKSRYDLVNISTKDRVDCVSILVNSFAAQYPKCIYRIQYWEEDEKIARILNLLFVDKANYCSTEKYKNGKNPGVVFIEMEYLSKQLLNTWLVNHYNFERAKEPSLNMRLQLHLSNEEKDILFDFYDDRGFDLYWYYTPQNT